MSARALAVAAVFVASAALFPTSPTLSTPAARASGSGQDAATTLDDQVELGVTVYNSDIALVRDVRNLQLGRGTSNLRFMDIAATINAATVHFRSLSHPTSLSVV